MSGGVKISELKNRLSYYLRKVRRGERVLVCDRDRVIASIEPAGGSGLSRDEDGWIGELEKLGVVRRPTGSLDRDFVKRRALTDGDAVAALLAEREEGR